MLSVLLLFTIQCSEMTMSDNVSTSAQLDSLSTPLIYEYPGIANFKAFVSTSDTSELEFIWHSSFGSLQAQNDSATVELPNIEIDCTISCVLLQNGQPVDTLTHHYRTIPPAFVGEFRLESVQACDTTLLFDPAQAMMLFDIYSVFRRNVGFVYALRIRADAPPRLGIPDTCRYALPLNSHYGFTGRHLQSATREDSLLYLTFPSDLGNYSVVFRWQDNGERIKLIKKNIVNNMKWTFVRFD